MKLPVDSKFLWTTSIILIVIALTVTLVNAIFGTTSATVTGGILGMVAIKLFDELDFEPSFTFEFGVPVISTPWMYSMIASVFILNGCTIGFDLFCSIWHRLDPSGYPCNIWLFAIAILLDWGSFIIGGYMIGRLFPKKALSLTAIAALFYIATILLDVHSFEGVAAVFERCLHIPKEDMLRYPTTLQNFKIGATFGVACRGFVAFLAARFASRKKALSETA